MKVVLATNNPDKAADIRAVLSSAVDVDLTGRPAEIPEVEETGATLVENARLKAAALVEATGMPALADDTGLEVDALGGAPGVFSSRYAGEDATYADNVAKLLDDMEAQKDRGARFRCVVVLLFPDGHELVAEGVVEGSIIAEPRGGEGFGYDPVFVPVEGDGRTFGEIGIDEKAAMSHRGRALRRLLELLTSP